MNKYTIIIAGVFLIIMISMYLFLKNRPKFIEGSSPWLWTIISAVTLYPTIIIVGNLFFKENTQVLFDLVTFVTLLIAGFLGIVMFLKMQKGDEVRTKQLREFNQKNRERKMQEKLKK